MKQSTFIVTYQTFSGEVCDIKVRSVNSEKAKSLVYEQVDDCQVSINAKKV